MSREENNKNEKVLNAWTAKNAAAGVRCNESLGVTQTYNRALYENQSAMRKFKEKQYGGKKTLLDPVTGNIVHKSHVAARNKYGSKYARHASETDHIISLKEGHDRFKRNPFLSDQDIKEILNSENNFRETARSVNNAKRAANDLQYALGIRREPVNIKGVSFQVYKKFDSSLDAKGKVRMIGGYLSAKASAAGETVFRTSKNAGAEFIDGASGSLAAAAVPLMVAGVQNICLVSAGEKTMEDAVKDMGGMAGSIAVSGGGLRLAADVVSGLAKNAGLEPLKKVLAHSNELSQIISVSLLIKDSFIKLINNDISGVEFFEEIGEKGVGLLGDVVGSIAGSFAMTGFLAPAVAAGTIAAGPAGFLVAAAGFVGAIVISTVCTEVYRYTANFRKAYKAIDDRHNEKMACINRIANEAIAEIEKQQKILKSMINTTFSEWDRQFEEGFAAVLSAALDDDFEQLSAGLNTILNVFGETVMFRTLDEFDHFFFDDNAVLTL